MSHRLDYGTVRESQRRVIHVLRVRDEILELAEIGELAERLREKLAFRGEVTADVVVVQGDSKETLALIGDPHSVNRVRAAMFNAALRWGSIDLT